TGGLPRAISRRTSRLRTATSREGAPSLEWLARTAGAAHVEKGDWAHGGTMVSGGDLVILTPIFMTSRAGRDRYRVAVSGPIGVVFDDENQLALRGDNLPPYRKRQVRARWAVDDGVREGTVTARVHEYGRNGAARIAHCHLGL